MMYTTLEHLEKKTAHKRMKHKVLHFLKEMKTLIFIFVFVSMGMIVFTNAKLFIANIERTVSATPQETKKITEKDMYQDGSIAAVIDETDQKSKEIEAMIEKYKTDVTETKDIAKPMEALLAENLKNYEFTFNTLPPTNRLLVPSLGVNDPIVTSKYKDPQDFTNENFDKELENGPVKYPTTPNPGEKGASLIFGHTSQEWRRNNPYGMAFAHITKLDPGDMLQIVREGKLLEYRVIEVIIKYPQHVNKEYLRYHNVGKSTDQSYVMLMGCYPIGTAKQRILVVGELIGSSK